MIDTVWSAVVKELCAADFPVAGTTSEPRLAEFDLRTFEIARLECAFAIFGLERPRGS